MGRQRTTDGVLGRQRATLYGRQKATDSVLGRQKMCWAGRKPQCVGEAESVLGRQKDTDSVFGRLNVKHSRSVRGLWNTTPLICNFFLNSKFNISIFYIWDEMSCKWANVGK